MAVDDKASFEQAERILAYLKMFGTVDDKVVILVANKTDLVRSRIVKPMEGKSLAVQYGTKYIETSPGKNNEHFSFFVFMMMTGINHHVDELLVGLVTQVRLRRGKLRERKNSATVVW